MKPIRTAILAWTVCITSSMTLAAEFKSGQGYSLTYPEDWTVLSKDQSKEVMNEIKRQFSNLADLDLAKIDVMIVDATPDDFAENINVVVVKDTVPLKTESDRQKAVREITQSVSGSDFGTRSVTHGPLKVNGRDSLLVKWTLHMSPLNTSVRQMIAVIPGRRHTYMVTCTADHDTFERYEPVFTRTVNSVQVDLGWRGTILAETWFRGALIGGIVGAVIGLVAWLKRKKQRPRPPARTWPAGSYPGASAPAPPPLPTDTEGGGQEPPNA